MSDRAANGRLGAYKLHSMYDSRELTRNAREAFLGKFERQVDPEGVLTLKERLRRADHARSEHFARLGRKSAAARKKQAARRDRQGSGDGTLPELDDWRLTRHSG